MSDDSQPTGSKKKHPVIVQIITAALSAFTAVSIAKLHENTEITKSKLGYEAIAKHAGEQDEAIKNNTQETIKLRATVETMNQILQFAFAAQAGIKVQYVTQPPIPTYGGRYPGSLPVRTVTPKKVEIPPPKKAATDAVAQLKTLSKKTKPVNDQPVKIEPLPQKLDEVKK